MSTLLLVTMVRDVASHRPVVAMFGVTTEPGGPRFFSCIAVAEEEDEWAGVYNTN